MRVTWCWIPAPACRPSRAEDQARQRNGPCGAAWHLFILDNGVDMRTTLTLTGIAAGVALTVAVQRWAPYFLVWLFSRGDDR